MTGPNCGLVHCPLIARYEALPRLVEGAPQAPRVRIPQPLPIFAREDHRFPAAYALAHSRLLSHPGRIGDEDEEVLRQLVLTMCADTYDGKYAAYAIARDSWSWREMHRVEMNDAIIFLTVHGERPLCDLL